MLKGNQICYHLANFLDCQRNPNIEPVWKYVIWYPDESEWAWQYSIASFDSEDQLKAFADAIGFTYEWTSERYDGFKSGRISVVFESQSVDKEPKSKWEEYYNKAFFSKDQSENEAGLAWLNIHFDDMCQAYSINSENLKSAKRIKALSNGSIVDCLFTNDGERVKFYRCNPNAKKYYKPLSLKEHIKYQREHGTY